MKVDIHCKGMELTEAIRIHVEDKLTKLDRILPGEVDTLVILDQVGSKQRSMFSSEITFRVWSHDLVSKSKAEDMYKAISDSVEQSHMQLRRLKDKRMAQRRGGTSIKDYQEPTVTYTEKDEYEDEYQASLKETEEKSKS